ncbi:hypothetical protein, partial [Treponema porcinum]|uniref:hypothetical protein n=1 Tax=Treponema porcinum TaxID=261392 RepID=UPI002355C8E3
SGDLNNFFSCKRREATYAQAAKAATKIISSHANGAKRRMRDARRHCPYFQFSYSRKTYRD